jgi:hypothetical protein
MAWRLARGSRPDDYAHQRRRTQAGSPIIGMDHAAITSAAGCQCGSLTFDGEGSTTVLGIVERNANIIAETIMRADAKMDRIDLKRFVERVKVTRAKFRNRHTISFSQYGEDTILWHLNPEHLSV